MLKLERIREEDYWLFPIVFLNIICITVAIYASVMLFRGPAIVVGFLGLWFTSSKIRKGYSPRRAKIHIGLTMLVSIGVTWITYILTN